MKGSGMCVDGGDRTGACREGHQGDSLSREGAYRRMMIVKGGKETVERWHGRKRQGRRKAGRR